MLKKILISLGIICVLIFTLTFLILQKNYTKKLSSTKIVTSFYPLYVITTNLLKDTPVEVSPLFSNIKGCIHDISLSTEQILTLNSAKALIINGVGMESSFLDKIDKSIKVIDTSTSSLILDFSSNDTDKDSFELNKTTNKNKTTPKNIPQQPSTTSNTSPSSTPESTNNKDSHSTIASHNHDHDSSKLLEESSVNQHYWLSLANYINQINNIKQGLLEIKELAAFYPIIEKNATTYIDKILQLKKDSLKRLSVLKNTKLYFLDETFKYLALDLQINSTFIPLHFHMGYKSSSQIFHTIKTIKQEKIKTLFTTEDIPDSLISTLEQDTDVKIYKLYTVITPEVDTTNTTNVLNSYINTYQKNIDIIVKAFSL